MKLSNNALRGIAFGSVLGMVGGCGSSLYLNKPTAEDEQMAEIQRNKGLATERVMSCLPREKDTSLSDTCLGLVKRYDYIAKDGVALENSPEYISSQRRKKYANYFAILNVLSFATSYASFWVLRKRTEEENQSTGEQ